MASKAPSKVQGTVNQLSSTVRSQPLATFRVVFFVAIWTLALANAVVSSREFENSLPFVINPTSRRRFGIEDPRRQALPVILAASIVLTALIPFVVGLPLFGIAIFLTRYAFEALWSLSISLLLLGGAAALAPHPDSPLLPRALQQDISTILALSFMIMLLLTIYNVVLLCRITFLMGKGTPNLKKATIFSLLPTEETQSEREAEKQPAEKQPENEEGDIDRLESGSAKSGWDDDDNPQPSKIEQRFAKAKSILISPLKQATFRT